jgi:hypothetical protein
MRGGERRGEETYGFDLLLKELQITLTVVQHKGRAELKVILCQGHVILQGGEPAYV